MARRVLVVLLLVASGCDVDSGKALDLLLGARSNTVVLTAAPVVLSGTALVLTPSEPASVLGPESSVCVALAGEIPLQDGKIMDRAFSDAMHDSKLKVEVVLATGERARLGSIGQAWRLRGVVTKENELAACARVSCGDTPLPTRLYSKG